MSRSAQSEVLGSFAGLRCQAGREAAAAEVYIHPERPLPLYKEEYYA